MNNNQQYNYNYGQRYQDPQQNVYNDPEQYAKSDYNNRQNQPVYQASVIDVKPVINLENNANNTNISRDSLRKGFIRKVLVILIVQLVFTTLAIAVTFIDKENTRKWMNDHQWTLYVALAVSLVTIIIMACFRNLFRKVPLNYLLLTLYTLATAYFLASIAAVSKSTSVLFAGGFTLFAVFVIACYAWKTKKDLTKKMSGILSVTSILLMILIFGIIFRSNIINVIIGAAFGVVFSFLFAINVQRLSGRYESKFSLDDYVIAALDLYIDIVQIFLAVLGVSNFVNK